MLELAGDTTRLPPGTTIHEVRARVAAQSGEFEPASVSARPGDVVRFVAADAATHAIAFEEQALGPDARDFLARTGQLRGPPLITTGTAWVVSLDGAPPAQYPFRCLTHDARGAVTVGS